MRTKKIIPLEKAKKARQVVEKTTNKTIKTTMTIVKIVFLLVIIYSIVVSIYLFLTSEQKVDYFFTNIALVSIGGFWAFFLGYFGWRMGETLENYLQSIRKK